MTRCAPVSVANPGPALAPPHTDWLRHDLLVTGPVADVTALRRATAGAGAIPWAYTALVQDTCKKWSQEHRAPQIPFCNSVLAHYGPIAAWTPRWQCRWKFAGVSGNGHADACQRDMSFQRDRIPLATGTPTSFSGVTACDHFLHVS